MFVPFHGDGVISQFEGYELPLRMRGEIALAGETIEFTSGPEVD